MRRPWITLLSAVFLLLGIAISMLWARSYWVEDQVIRGFDVPGRTATEWVTCTETWRSSRGVLEFTRYRVGFVPRRGAGEMRWFNSSAPTTVGDNVLGFSVRLNSLPTGRDFGVPWRLCVPHVALVLLLLALPAARARLAVRDARRRAAGQCIRCGYDLRATPDRCPECGTTTGWVA